MPTLKDDEVVTEFTEAEPGVAPEMQGDDDGTDGDGDGGDADGGDTGDGDGDGGD